MSRLSKKRKTLGGILLPAAAACLLVTVGMRAQAPPAQDAVLVVQRALAAHGSRWSEGGIADWVAEGTLTFFSTDGPKATFDTTLMRRGGAQVQRIIKQPAGNLKQGSDGTRSWESIPGFFAPAQGRTVHFIESQTLRSLQRLFNYQAEGLSLRDLGMKNSARLIEAEDRQGRKTSFHINSDTSIVSRMEFVVGEAKGPFGGSPVPIADAYVFSDYRMTQGVLTAFKIERFMDDTRIEEMVFNTVRYNAALQDQDFMR